MKIVIYSAPSCGACKQAKEYLESINVEFTEIDVSKDFEAGQEMQRKTGAMSLPVIIIGNEDEQEILIGYSKEKLSEAIKC